MSNAAAVAKLPTPGERLEKEARKAWRAYKAAEGAALQAQLDQSSKPSEAHERALELAKLDRRRKRAVWIQAEDKKREAGA